MANLDGTGNNATFKGDVVVFKEPATYLYTSELFYNIKKANIHTPQKVKIVEPDKITTGVGLDSNLKLKKIRLLDKVKVIMKDKEE
ncbi:MAG: LPS export ABC transporter periplasmic protein LptC [Candidatus Muiribacterium halophilum]|uniref:LPS export ABC transporter periplasmic protein LptC n=1 Tax=Muiribacterium halophilum TaxID=2053465 RepID=A0A2N5Z914_MUIH1|nr:MAG: LPS export ABC transporter periplasmic protein LptC [Candidatus Muirbacterium halophilum]